MSLQPFIKYPDIENFDQSKYVQRFLDKFPELANAKFIIQEKINGANVAFIFTPKMGLQIASRENLIANNPHFYNIKKTLESLRFQIFTTHVQSIIDDFKVPVTLYGEYFGRDENGKNVCKGVEYGGKGTRDILFYDMRVESGHLSSQADFYKFVKDYQLADYQVPTLGVAKNLDEAFATDTKFDSKLNPIKDNLCEGITIKPIAQQYIIDDRGFPEYFMLKKKNEEFKEKQRAKRPPPVPGEIDERFYDYVTEERANHIESHLGPITAKNQLGQYIKELVNDAEIDFWKDLPDAKPASVALAKKKSSQIACKIFMKRC